MMAMKKICAVLLAAVLVCMTGCTTELYQQMLIKGFGIDKDGEGYKVTVRYAALNEEDKEEQSVVTGSTVYEALNSLSLTTGKKQMYSSAGYVIYGRAVAQEGLDKALDFFVRYFKSGPTISLYVADKTAAEILETEKDGKLISSDAIKAFSDNQENWGKTASATALSFISDVKREGSDAVAPLLEKEGDSLRCTRSAVFRDYRMVRTLSETETNGYLAGKGRLKNGSIVVEMEQAGKVTLTLTKTSAKIRCSMEGDKPLFTVAVQAEAVLSSEPLLKGRPDFRALEQAVSKKLQRDCEEALALCRENGSDPLGFGYILYTDETKYWKTVSRDWQAQLKTLSAQVQVTTDVVSIGEEDKPSYSST